MKLTNSYSGRGGCMIIKKRGSLVRTTTETFSQSFSIKLSRLHAINEKQGFQKNLQKGGDGKRISIDRFF